MAIIKNGFLINTSKNVGGTVFYKYKGDQFSRSMPQYPEGWIGSDKQRLMARMLGSLSHALRNDSRFESWVNMNYTRRGRRYRGTGRSRAIGWAIDRIVRDSDGNLRDWKVISNLVGNLEKSELTCIATISEALPIKFNDYPSIAIRDVVIMSETASRFVLGVSVREQDVIAWVSRQRIKSPRSFSPNYLILVFKTAHYFNTPTAPLLSARMDLTTVGSTRYFQGSVTIPISESLVKQGSFQIVVPQTITNTTADVFEGIIAGGGPTLSYM